MELVDTSENQWSIQEFPSTDTPLFMQWEELYLKKHEDLQRKYRYIKKQKQDLQEELDEFKHKLAELEKEKGDQVAELATYKSLNITLQQSLNEVLQRAFSKTGPSLLNRPSAPFESTLYEGPDELPNSPEGNNPPLNKNTSESTLSLYEIKDGTAQAEERVVLGKVIWRLAVMNGSVVEG